MTGHISALALAAALLCACTGNTYVQVSGYAQGGTWSVKYKSSGCRMRPEQIKNGIDSILNRIDFTVSGYNKASELSRLNNGDSVVLSRDFAELYRISRKFFELSEGAFDVSCGPLFDIWGFGFKSGEMPSADEIASALHSCGMSRMISADALDALTGKTICAADLLREGEQGPAPQLNFNAVAQGWSCDKVAAYLHSFGIKDMLVDIGEIYCEGLNQYGKGWTIGIDNPADGNNEPGKDIRDVWTSDGGAYGVVTSGNYRKYYIRDGHKYSHTIDPRTGRPVEHDLLSATVIAPDAATADALATYYMVIGKDKAMECTLSLDGVETCLICSDQVFHSPGF